MTLFPGDIAALPLLLGTVGITNPSFLSALINMLSYTQLPPLSLAKILDMIVKQAVKR